MLDYSYNAEIMLMSDIMIDYLRTNPTKGFRTFTYLGVSYSIRVLNMSLTPIYKNYEKKVWKYF